jgi:hypothetical protein
VLDYDNEYANLIINHNLSYETVALNEKTKNEAGSKALLPAIVEKFLNRRIYFEEISKELPEESREYLWCQQRLDSLKNIYFQCQVLQFPFSNFVVLMLTKIYTFYQFLIWNFDLVFREFNNIFHALLF